MSADSKPVTVGVRTRAKTTKTGKTTTKSIEKIVAQDEKKRTKAKVKTNAKGRTKNEPKEPSKAKVKISRNCLSCHVRMGTVNLQLGESICRSCVSKHSNTLLFQTIDIKQLHCLIL
jgi:hypothetical protein